jgi:gamma-glutamyltranspeptidase/glutathione hydrolase
MTSFAAGRRAFLIALTLAVIACGPSNAQDGRRSLYMPPAPGTFHPVPGEFGMVVAQEKLAAQIGADVLRQGGNAVDAAVATGFAMAVTYPRAGNIGGGGFMVIHSADAKEDIAIDYRETAPAATTRDVFLGTDGKPDIAKSRDSALSIGVPGTVAGLTLALEKYGSGKLTLRAILKPAIDLAARLAQAAGTMAVVREDLLPRRWLFAARGRHAGAERSRGDADGDSATGPARLL